MKTLRYLLLMTLCMLHAFESGQAAESLSVLLQKGIYAEETEGDLEGAIEIYEGIVKDGATQHSIAAQAQYRLGVCKQKRGDKEGATLSFRDLIEKFPSETELIAEARARLSELGQLHAATMVRQLWATLGEMEPSGPPSNDGRLIALVDWSTGDLAIRDLKAGINRRWTNKEKTWDESSGFALQPIFSPDGKQIAYTWFHDDGERSDLRVFDLADSKARTWVEMDEEETALPGDWAPDGRSIAVTIASSEIPTQVPIQFKYSIALVATEDGVKQELAPPTAGRVTTLRFSPDGSLLAYNRSQNDARGSAALVNDIYVMDARTGERRKVVEHIAKEQFIGWAPSGRAILFSSERRGSADLWALEVDGLQVTKAPELVKPDLGAITPLGLTANGQLYYTTEVSKRTDVHVASVDFETGEKLSSLKLIESLFNPPGMVSSKIVPSFDGRRLFFCAGTTQPTARVLNLDNLEEREIPNSAAWARRVGWWRTSVNGSSLLVILGYGEGAGYHMLDPDTGEMKAFALYSDGNWRKSESMRVWYHPDFVIYTKRYVDSDKLVVVKHDLRTGDASEHEVPGLPATVSRDPGRWAERGSVMEDGRSLLFNRPQGEGNVLLCHDLITGAQTELMSTESPVLIHKDVQGRLLLGPISTGEKRVLKACSIVNSKLEILYEIAIPEGFSVADHSLAEPSVVLKKALDPPNHDSAEVWRVSARDGVMRKMNFTLPSEGSWRIFEQQKRLLIRTGYDGRYEMWMMENFLPAALSANIKDAP